MKLALFWCTLLSAVFVITIGAGSCSINHRSGDYACTKQADCAAGRVCTDNLCVLQSQLDSGVKLDAPKPPPDAQQCPSQCTSCDTAAKTCVIDCALNGGACNNSVVCPTGYDCDIRCTTGNSCRNGVNCLNAASCQVTCSGSSSCRNVACGMGKCAVDCSGNQSCRGVGCAQSCACDVTCHINSACEALTCPSGCFSVAQFGGCSSLPPGCNTCQ